MGENTRSMLDQHKRIVHQIFEEVWTNANFERVTDMVAPHISFYYRGKTVNQSPDDLIALIQAWKAVFPDLRFEVKETVAEGNLVAVRVVYRGTQEKEWKGIPALGNQIEVDEMIFFRFENGRIVEVWEVADEYAERQQLLGTNT